MRWIVVVIVVVVVDQTEHRLKSSQHFLQGFSRIAAPLTSMLKTTGSSDSAPRALGADNDEVVGGDSGGTDETIDKSAKPKNIKKSLKAKKKSAKARRFGKTYLPKLRS